MTMESIRQILQDIKSRQPANPVLQGWSSYAQFDEDGIIRECLGRISAHVPLSKTAVEVGCGDGTENNSHQLVLEGFSAVWVDGAEANIERMRRHLGGTVFQQLLILEEVVSRRNAPHMATDARYFLGTESVDIFSLDIDGNDIHVCAPFIDILHPKLVCVEYNARFPPPMVIAMAYDEAHAWSNDDYFGASLQAWVSFFSARNYTLVCCNLTGANAFFVDDRYLGAFTMHSPRELYQPARYHLIGYPKGHPPSLSWLRQVLGAKTDAGDTGVAGQSVPSVNPHGVPCTSKSMARPSAADSASQASEDVAAFGSNEHPSHDGEPHLTGNDAEPMARTCMAHDPKMTDLAHPTPLNGDASDVNIFSALSVSIVASNYGKMAIFNDDQVIGRALRTSGEFQEAKIFEVVAFLKDRHELIPDIFVDIGANIGTHSIFALVKGGFERAVAFEPDVENARLLRKNVGINRLGSRFEIHAVALSDEPGPRRLEMSSSNFGDHRIQPTSPAAISFGEEHERVTKAIWATTLDALHAQGPLDWSNALVWVDTQGHEGPIFAGGKTFLASSGAPVAMVVEFWPYGIERSGSKQAYFEFLAACSAIHDINAPGWQRGEATSLGALETMYTAMLEATEKEHHPHTDLLLIRGAALRR